MAVIGAVLLAVGSATGQIAVSQIGCFEKNWLSRRETSPPFLIFPASGWTRFTSGDLQGRSCSIWIRAGARPSPRIPYAFSFMPSPKSPGSSTALVRPHGAPLDIAELVEHAQRISAYFRFLEAERARATR
jgi:hypothetical protein